MSNSPVHEIVPPEPHSTGADFRRAWSYMPRWLQVVLLLAFIVVGILVAISHVDRFPLPANESSAVGSLRTLYFASIAYAKAHPEDGFPKKLNDLSWRSDNPAQHDGPEWMIDPALAAGLKTGYRLAMLPVAQRGKARSTLMKSLRTHSNPANTGNVISS